MVESLGSFTLAKLAQLSGKMPKIVIMDLYFLWLQFGNATAPKEAMASVASVTFEGVFAKNTLPM
jgi:hypothetical protein